MDNDFTDFLLGIILTCVALIWIAGTILVLTIIVKWLWWLWFGG